MNKNPVIAIDGPAASGKGTVAKGLANALGFHYLESGALYRLVAFVAQRESIDPNNAPALAQVASALQIRFVEDQIFLSGQEVAEQLRVESIGNLASQIAAHPALRRALLERQRAFRAAPGLSCDGRDMGTVVFPDAALKVFYTARVEVRAERRLKQLKQKGLDANLADLSRDLAERDARDAARATAPLAAAADALILDASDLRVDQALDVLMRWARERQIGVTTTAPARGN